MSSTGFGLVALDNGLLRVLVQPDLGAGLTQVAVRHRDRWHHLLRPLAGRAADPRQLACCLLIPWSNRLYRGGFSWRGRQVVVPPGRLDGRLPLHGDAWLAPWRVVTSTPTQALLERQTDEPAVFQYAAQVRYRLEGRQLHVSLGVRHRGPRPLPYGLGVHPWFVRGPDTVVRFSSVGRWEPDATQVPGEFRPLDGAHPLSFNGPKPLPGELIDHLYAGWDGVAEVRWPGSGIAARLQADTPARHLVVYSPPPVSGQSGFVCLEPVTHCNDAHGAPDPLAGGLVELRTGERFDLEVSLEALVFGE